MLNIAAFCVLSWTPVLNLFIVLESPVRRKSFFFDVLAYGIVTVCIWADFRLAIAIEFKMWVSARFQGFIQAVDKSSRVVLLSLRSNGQFCKMITWSWVDIRVLSTHNLLCLQTADSAPLQPKMTKEFFWEHQAFFLKVSASGSQAQQKNIRPVNQQSLVWIPVMPQTFVAWSTR